MCSIIGKRDSSKTTKLTYCLGMTRKKKKSINHSLKCNTNKKWESKDWKEKAKIKIKIWLWKIKKHSSISFLLSSIDLNWRWNFRPNQQSMWENNEWFEMFMYACVKHEMTKEFSTMKRQWNEKCWKTFRYSYVTVAFLATQGNTVFLFWCEKILWMFTNQTKCARATVLWAAIDTFFVICIFQTKTSRNVSKNSDVQIKITK